MLVAKQVADLITTSRALLAFYLAWLGVTQGETALPIIVWLMIANWTGDTCDGALARRSRISSHTWVGDHDLEIDILVSLGLLVYMMTAGLANILLGGLYLLAWVVIILWWGFPRALGMLIQAPIYGGFIWTAVLRAPGHGWWLVVWIVLAVAITWPRFPQEVVPGFLDGLRAIGRQRPE